MNITEEIERSIGSGPPLPSPTARLAAGKSAVRRRRLAVGVAASLVLAVLGGSVATAVLLDRDAKSEGEVVIVPNPDVPIEPDALQPGHIVGYDEDGRLVRRDDGIRVTYLAEEALELDGLKNVMLEVERGKSVWWLLLYQNPDGSFYETFRGQNEPGAFEQQVEILQEGEAFAATNEGGDVVDDSPGHLGQDGELQLMPGARLIKRVDNPLPVDPPNKSIGLVIERGGVTYWILDRVKGGSFWTTRADDSDYPTFEMWVDNILADWSGGKLGSKVELVRFGADHELVPLPGVTIVRQLSNAQLGDLRRPDEVSAVAEVRFQGRTWFVLATDLTSWKQTRHTFSPTVAKPGRATMTEYLEYLRSERDPLQVTP